MRWAYPTNNSHWRDAELPDWIPEVADPSSGWLVGELETRFGIALRCVPAVCRICD